MNDEAPKSIWGGLIDAILHTEDGAQKIANDPTLQSITKKLFLLEETKDLYNVQVVLSLGLPMCMDYERHWINSPLLDQLIQLRNIPNYHDYLTYAAGWGHCYAVKFLLDRGATMRYNISPLTKGCLYGHLEVIRLLLPRGDIIPWTKMMEMACIGGHLQVVKFLLEYDAAITATATATTTSATAISLVQSLSYACQFGHFHIVKFLLAEKGIDVHSNDDQALRIASEHGQLEIVEYLLEQGADTHTYGDGPLHTASGNGHVQIVELLLTQADQTSLDTALVEASMAGKNDVVRLLLTHGASVSSRVYNALEVASENNHADTVEILLAEHNTDIIPQCYIAAAKAIESGYIDVVRVFLDYGFDLYNGSVDGIVLAAENGRNDIVQLLLKRYAPPTEPAFRVADTTTRPMQ